MIDTSTQAEDLGRRLLRCNGLLAFWCGDAHGDQVTEAYLAVIRFGDDSTTYLEATEAVQRLEDLCFAAWAAKLSPGVNCSRSEAPCLKSNSRLRQPHDSTAPILRLSSLTIRTAEQSQMQTQSSLSVRDRPSTRRSPNRWQNSSRLIRPPSFSKG